MDIAWILYTNTHWYLAIVLRNGLQYGQLCIVKCSSNNTVHTHNEHWKPVISHSCEDATNINAELME